jgi:hypothetical protein
VSPAYNARLAQSVEQWIENPRVPGSIPGPGTIKIKGLEEILGLFLCAAVSFRYTSKTNFLTGTCST